MARGSFGKIGKMICVILKANGNIARFNPWITLETIEKEKLIANPANNAPNYIDNIIN
jgi:hypothetical protein